MRSYVVDFTVSMMHDLKKKFYAELCTYFFCYVSSPSTTIKLKVYEHSNMFMYI